MSRILPNDPRFTRRQRELLRDLEVSGKLKDIRDAEQLRDQLSPKWWEAGVGVVQFAAALGLLAGVLQYPEVRKERLLQLLAFFFTVMILSLVFGFEFMIFKLYHLRRAHAIAQRRIHQLEARIDALERGAGAAPADAAAQPEPPAEPPESL